MTKPPPPIDLDEIEALSGELLRTLTPHAGDADAVHRTLTGYRDALDWHTFAMACITAVRDTFADCLTLTDPADVPPGALALVPPEGETAA